MNNSGAAAIVATALIICATILVIYGYGAALCIAAFAIAVLLFNS